MTSCHDVKNMLHLPQLVDYFFVSIVFRIDEFENVIVVVFA